MNNYPVVALLLAVLGVGMAAEVRAKQRILLPVPEGCLAYANDAAEAISEDGEIESMLLRVVPVGREFGSIVGVLEISSEKYGKLELERKSLEFQNSCYSNAIIRVSRQRPDRWQVVGRELSELEKAHPGPFVVEINSDDIQILFRSKQ